MKQKTCFKTNGTKGGARGGDEGALAAAAAAGRAAQVVRVAGAAVQGVVRLEPHAHLAGVGRAEHQRAGSLQPRHRRRVLGHPHIPDRPAMFTVCVGT